METVKRRAGRPRNSDTPHKSMRLQLAPDIKQDLALMAQERHIPMTVLVRMGIERELAAWWREKGQQ